MSNEESIFAEASALPSAADRAAFLDRACAGDVELRRQVEELLLAHDRAARFLESPPAALRAADGPTTRQESDATAPPADEGRVVGRYKLLERIGEGGMGVVYMAGQTHPVRRRVALKLIKPGLDSAQVIARFEAERQALALMDHPNIARVLDAGATDDGRPYFVMEFVRGIPITDYCDQEKLTPAQRLGLFAQVCHAVQHAHQKGIIHRDLKPNNVLVTVDDGGRPVSKIIDFGIAKATAGQQLTDHTLYTEFRQLLGTPLYMSPEQAEMSAVTDVDTRSDVYSLGVLLYELLTGTTPFDADRLKKAAFDEIRRIIREEEPPRPSTRISTLGHTLTGVSAKRQIDPQRLGQTMRGELDWIVMKCLEKDRGRRYESASGVARDVERFLSDQPVEACPPSRTYRLRKFARRNKAALATTTTLAAVLIAATIVSTWQAVRATRAERQVAHQRDQAREEKRRADEQAAIASAVNDFLDDDVLGQASPSNQASIERNVDRDLKVRDALDRAANGVAERFKGKPRVEAAIRRTIGRAYYDLGEYQKAEVHLDAALTLSRRVDGDSGVATQDCLLDLALLYQVQGRYTAAEALVLKVLGIRRDTLGERDPATLAAMFRLASLYLTTQEFAKAKPLFLQVLEAQRKLLGDEDDATLATTHNLGALYWCEGSYDEAEPLLEKSLEAARRRYGPQNDNTLAGILSLANLYRITDRFGKAEPLYREGLESCRAAYGDPHPSTLMMKAELALLLIRQNKPDQAETLLLESLEGRRAALGNHHKETLNNLLFLGALYEAQQQPDKAERYYREVVDSRREALGSKPPDEGLGLALHLVARAELAGGKAPESECDYQAALEAFRLVKADRMFEDAAREFAAILREQKRFTEVVPLFREILSARERLLQPDDDAVFNARMELAAALIDGKAFGNAEELLVAADAELKAHSVPAALAGRRGNTLDNLARLYWAWGKTEKWRERTLERQALDVMAASAKIAAASGDADPALPGALLARARAYVRLSLFDKAENDLTRVVRLGKAEIWTYYYLGSLHAYRGDLLAYRKACRAMFEHSKHSADGEAIERTAKTCLLLPDGAGVDPRRLLDWNEPALAAADARHRPFHLLVKALGLYRVNDFLTSAETAEEVAKLNSGLTPTASLIEAMAQHRSGNGTAARAALERAEGLVRDTLGQVGKDDLGAGVEGWLICHVLLREAQGVIKPTAPGGPTPATHPAAVATPGLTDTVSGE